jgi:hypothetical protein
MGQQQSTGPLGQTLAGRAARGLTVDTARADDQVSASAFDAFLAGAPTRSWLAATGTMMSSPVKQARRVPQGSPTMSSPRFTR